MTKEQLLIPRVLCIGGKPGDQNYPGSRFMTGDIIEQNGRDYWGIKADAWISQTTVDRYPNLFKPLPWWYGRTVEEMPQYVKDENGEVWKVTKYFIDSSVACFYTGEIEKKGWLKGTETPFNLLAVEPADLTDYMEYQKQNDA